MGAFRRGSILENLNANGKVDDIDLLMISVMTGSLLDSPEMI